MALATDEYGLPRLAAPIGEWTDQALCKELCAKGEASPDDWFPTGGNVRAANVAAAKAACERCPVQKPCASWAIKHNEEGIWGGMWGRDIRAAHFATSRQCAVCMRFFKPDEQRRSKYCGDVCRKKAELQMKSIRKARDRDRKRYGN